MPKFIFTLHERVKEAIKKGLSGYVSPDKIDNEVHAEQLNIWRKYLDDYAKTQIISMFLKPFERIEAVVGLGGSAAEGTKQVVFSHKYPISVMAGTIPVTRLTISEYDLRLTHPNKPPTADFPICKFVSNVIYVAPRMDVAVSYIGVPVKPKYAFTIDGDAYVYDDAASIDIEFPEELHDDIGNRVLANIGINMRDPAVVQYSKQEQTTEGQ